MPLAPRDSMKATTRFTTSPAAATIITVDPATGTGESKRWTASTAIQTINASIASALTKAASTSARA